MAPRRLYGKPQLASSPEKKWPVAMRAGGDDRRQVLIVPDRPPGLNLCFLTKVGGGISYHSPSPRPSPIKGEGV